MGVLDLIRDLLRPARPPVAPHARPRVLHLAGSQMQPACGVPWSPADPVTIEGKAVECLACRRVVRRREVDRLFKRR